MRPVKRSALAVSPPLRSDLLERRHAPEPIETPPIRYPFAHAPAAGDLVEVAPSVVWISTVLPFRLKAVNCYLIEDEHGWTVVDCGYARPDVQAQWEHVWATLCAQRPIDRLVITHFHPDHTGNSAFICDRWGLRPFMTQTEWLAAQLAATDRYSDDVDAQSAFFVENGLDMDRLATYRAGHVLYRHGVRLPGAAHRLSDGDVLTIGGSTWEVIVGEGHSPEHAMLYCAERKVLIAGDQLLPEISPNTSAWHSEPEADAVGLFVATLAGLADRIAPDTLVLPAHRRPFVGVRRRCDELVRHHRARLHDIVAAAAQGPMTAGDLLGVLFPQTLDGHQIGFAMGETIAHLTYLAKRGHLVRVARDGVTSYVQND